MMESITSILGPDNVEAFTRLLMALLLGSVLGIERVFAHKTAGMRTYALVSFGAALFVVISFLVYKDFTGLTNFDPLRVASQIVVGLGFLGAGTIVLRKDDRISGLTTAAGLWVSGAIGAAAGFGLYHVAIFSAFLVLATFTILWFIESKIKKVSGVWDQDRE